MSHLTKRDTVIWVDEQCLRGTPSIQLPPPLPPPRIGDDTLMLVVVLLWTGIAAIELWVNR